MKSIAEKTIKKYLPKLKVEGRSIRPKNVPALYCEIYEFEELNINQRPFLVIRVRDKMLGPRDFKKHGKVLKEKINLPQIWYLKELHFNKVQVMIDNAYNFVIERKQVHLPSVNISIKPEGRKNESRSVKLTGMSVNMIIREILKGDLSGKNKVEIAKLFKTTKMTVGRAIRPLLENELCTEEKIGVSKYIQFLECSDLWAYLKKNIKTPVQESVFIEKIPKTMPLSGISALSKKSMLTDDEIQTFASDKKVFKKGFKGTVSVLQDFASSKVELWDRPPILVKDNCINIIDIFLVNRDEIDERVKIELEKLLKNIIWK